MSRRLAPTPRRLAFVGAITLACGGWILVRTGGITGGGDSDFRWRWSPTPEERLLAAEPEAPQRVAPAASPAVAATEAGAVAESTHGEEEPAAVESARPPAPTPAGAPSSVAEVPEAAERGTMATEVSAPEWPGFRGRDRNSVVRGVRLETDWSASPPVELWRRPVGPGWSSFAVDGDLSYTQEQRGDDELVSCYRVSTGELVWRHSDAERFWESNAGAGPRSTPTLSGGRVYTLGATGVLNALEAGNGAPVWARNAAADTGAPIPGWGFSSSPLVIDDLVIVYVGALAAYDLATGEPRWQGPRAGSYSSPHLVTLDGVEQILMLSGAGGAGFAVADGTKLWEYATEGGIVQPAMTGDGDILFNSAGMAGGTGVSRVAVARAKGHAANAELQGTGGWTVEERWTSNRLKPNFNDFVVHRGVAYGFDARILAAIDLETGERHWKGGRYGYGQVLLLADQDLLLVLSEKGELALVEARPEGFQELAFVPAIAGKTWNHPVLVGDVLLVRNGEEMAAFRLALGDG